MTKSKQQVAEQGRLTRGQLNQNTQQAKPVIKQTKQVIAKPKNQKQVSSSQSESSTSNFAVVHDFKRSKGRPKLPTQRQPLLSEHSMHTRSYYHAADHQKRFREFCMHYFTAEIRNSLERLSGVVGISFDLTKLSDIVAKHGMNDFEIVLWTLLIKKDKQLLEKETDPYARMERMAANAKAMGSETGSNSIGKSSIGQWVKPQQIS